MASATSSLANFLSGVTAIPSAAAKFWQFLTRPVSADLVGLSEISMTEQDDRADRDRDAEDRRPDRAPIESYHWMHY